MCRSGRPAAVPCAKFVNISWPTGVHKSAVPPLIRKLLLGLVPAAAAWAANTQISTDKPIVNFRLPTYTTEGFRAWLVRGSEARFFGDNQIDIKEFILSVFSGRADEKVDTLILSPSAVVQQNDAIATGPDTIRVIGDQFEASGSLWRYEHKTKKITINRNVRVILHAEFKDYLK